MRFSAYGLVFLSEGIIFDEVFDDIRGHVAPESAQYGQ